MLVSMVPEFSFVQQKEEHQANEQRHEQLVCTDFTLKGLRQQVHESRGQQSAGRQAQHVLRIARQHPKTQGSGKPDAAHARKQGADKNSKQNHQKPLLCRTTMLTRRAV